jgi:hypothetical protein
LCRHIPADVLELLRGLRCLAPRLGGAREVLAGALERCLSLLEIGADDADSLTQALEILGASLESIEGTADRLDPPLVAETRCASPA